MTFQEQLQHIFNSDFPGIGTFIQDVIIPIMGNEIAPKNDDLVSHQEYAEKAAKAGIKSLVYVADITEQNYSAQNIALFDVTLSNSVNVERARVNIQQLIRSIVGYYSHILIVFHYEDPTGKAWRFSYAHKIDSQANTTPAKRYTYVFGRDFRSRTAAERFQVLGNSARTDADFESAFSVQALSDEFFDLYRAYYAVFVEYLTGEKYTDEKKLNGIISRWDWIQKDESNQFTTTFEDNAKSVRDYIKKMFGRIVFLYFLQRKGWLYDADGNADARYIRHLFDGAGELKATFLDDVLELLFFYVLNTKPEQRVQEAAYAEKDITILPGWEKIPFLNGGLFSQDEIDPKKCVFPAEYFDELFSFLDSYNFTIDENDQEDAEVGIDPEMLGRIFENLLEDNKDKGAFYTPKEIVDYMCRESIIAYLQDDRFSDDGNEVIREFIETLNIDLLNTEQRNYIEKRLGKVKICDPAIGSGAFPMGLVNLLSKLFIVLRTYGEIDQARMKRYIMEESIYGVDIEQGAVDIARLRFWLSMVVDETEPRPLPNLHFKIMQGNSLLESYNGRDLSDFTTFQTEVQDGEIDFGPNYESEELNSLLRKYYSESNHTEQARMLTNIRNNVNRQMIGKGVEFTSDLDITSNSQFFLWHTWFADVFKNGGFDIVIGNPPYGATLSESEKDLYRRLYPETEFKIDTYSLFLLLAVNLMKSNGILYYIIPNTLLDNYFEEGVRKKLLARQILEINDLSDQIFENAVVHSMIFGFKNYKTDGNNYIIKCNIGEELISQEFYIDSDFFYKQQKTMFSIRNWESRLLYDKLNANSVKLQDVLNIRQAIKSGDDKSYISSCKKDETYKPILRGKDIKRFSITEPGLFIHYGSFLACPRTPDIFEQPKILIREAGATITAALDYNHNYIMSSLYNCILIDKRFYLEYLLGLINSKIFQHLMNKLTFEKTKGAFTKAKIFHYYELPVKIADVSQQTQIVEIVKQIMSATAKGQLLNNLELTLSILIYHLYELTYDEVLIVDPETPITREEYDNFKLQ